jgi:hypothetical protein
VFELKAKALAEEQQRDAERRRQQQQQQHQEQQANPSGSGTPIASPPARPKTPSVAVLRTSAQRLSIPQPQSQFFSNSFDPSMSPTDLEEAMLQEAIRLSLLESGGPLPETQIGLPRPSPHVRWRLTHAAGRGGSSLGFRAGDDAALERSSALAALLAVILLAGLFSAAHVSGAVKFALRASRRLSRALPVGGSIESPGTCPLCIISRPGTRSACTSY